MAAVVAESGDIDSFISKQKNQLQYEREALTGRRDVRHHQDNRFTEEQKYFTEENSADVDDGEEEVEGVENNDVNWKYKAPSPRRRPKTPAETGLPLGKYEDERKKLNDERKREYNEKISKKRQEETGKNPTGLPPRPSSSRGLFAKLGKKDQDKQKLRDERQKEYNKYMAQQKPVTKGKSLEVPDDEALATLPGIRDHQSAELVKMKQRNDEYNVFLREKQEQDKHRFDDKKAAIHGNPEMVDLKTKNKTGIFASIPGLSYSDSPQIRKEIERNKEYNQFLSHKIGGAPGRGPRNEEVPPPVGAPRRGWQTPTYEEILDKKRKEEAQYRRNDPDYGRQQEEEDRKIEREFNARKAKFRDYPQGILEDDDWLNPDRRETEYADLRGERRPEVDQLEEDEKVDRSDKENMPRSEAPYYATLPVGRSGIIGQEVRESAKRRKREEYRKELELQIKETEAAKRREKLQDLKVSATGFLDPEKNANRMGQLGQAPTEVSPRREYRAPDVQAYHTKFDLQQREPRGRSILDAEREFDDGPIRSGRRRDRGVSEGYTNSGILEKGFDGFLEPRRPVGNIQPPPGLMYQPSTYITAGSSNTTTGFGGPSGPYSSIDEAYHYYGMKNPLEPEAGGPGPGPTQISQADPRLSFGHDQPSPTPRVTFDENVQTRRLRDRSRERISPYQFSSEDDGGRKSRQDQQQAYQADLDRQIYEKKMKQAREKQKKEMQERRFEEENKNYNPFGRGGGGAPIKDERGNAIADLRLVLKGNEGGETYRTPRYESPSRLSPTSRLGSPKDDLIRAPPSQTNFTGETTFARGGHGIFGMPKTESEKTQMEKYKDELRKQIEEKKMKEQIEKEKEKFEEEKENKRLEEQRLKIQAEYEEEFRKTREKEAEARRKNEEIKQQADQLKKDNERKKKEAEEKHLQKLREQEEKDRRERLGDQENQQRSASPPVPAARKLTEEAEERAEERKKQRQKDLEPQPGPSTQSELIQTSPDPRYSPPKRTNSSEVLGELARMRKQLETERLRVQTALENSKNEPEVFDPRMVQRPPPRDLVILERDRDRRAALPPRAGSSDSANQKNLQTFNDLKNKSNSDSRRQFRSLFPDNPTSGSALEAQQDALLRQQEDTLRHLSDKRLFEKSSPNPQPKDLGFGRPGNISPRSLLLSNSAFIDVEGVNYFPNDFEDMPPYRMSSRQRRRDRIPLSPRPDALNYNPLGSNTSLDVDRIQQKNDDRLRKLRTMNTNDDVSLADPDDILNSFMAKQSYRNRPPSGQTLQDDSWMRPDSKHI